MSVISQVLGSHSSFIEVPFLNLMANLEERAGGVVIRLGGNTQEYASMVDSLQNGLTFSKSAFASNQTTQTPAVVYTIDMFYMTANISSMLNVKWFLGIPFNDSVNWRLTMAEKSQHILGQLTWSSSWNGHRPSTYGPQDYANDVGNLIKAMEADSGIPNKNMFISPSVDSSTFIVLIYQLLPSNIILTKNCAAQFTINAPIIDPQSIFSNYTNHAAVVTLVQPYLNSTLIAQGANKPFYMFETNTVSLWRICGDIRFVWSCALGN